MINGGPAYPLATPGIRVLTKLSEEMTVSAAVLSGDPAGSNCNDDPQVCNRHGTTFSFTGGVLAIAEVAYAINHGNQAMGLPGVYKLGLGYESADFPDQLYGVSTSGAVVPLADSTVAGPLNHNGNWGIYSAIDQTIWQEQERSVNLFVRGSVSPYDRNLISYYAVAADQDALAVNGPPQPIRDHEMVFEVTYTLQVAPWWIIQPDFQYIIHPGGNVANPDNPNVTVGNAAIAGLRSTFTF